MKYKIIIVALFAINLLIFVAVNLNTYERRQKYLKAQAQIQALELQVQKLHEEVKKKNQERLKKANASPPP